mmetsp:Transcript_13602/g.20361  ORF Transcript_13602/g.20361 Transcript_13602/m.20361 type:complete len:210 (+) Transcript_13602:51-680(+)
MLDLRSAALIAAPAIPLALLSNECKWILQTWKPNPILHAPVFQTLGLRIFATTSVVLSISSVVAVGLEPHFGSAQCKITHVSLVTLLTVAAVSSVAACALKPNRRRFAELQALQIAASFPAQALSNEQPQSEGHRQLDEQQEDQQHDLYHGQEQHEEGLHQGQRLQEGHLKNGQRPELQESLLKQEPNSERENVDDVELARSTAPASCT